MTSTEPILWRTEPQWDGRRWTGTYAEYLKTEWWAICRRHMLKIARYRCQRCFWKKGMPGHQSGRWLEVHHKSYDRLGDEWTVDLVVLCCTCHAREHGKPDRRLGGPVPLSEALRQYLTLHFPDLLPALEANSGVETHV